MRYTRQRMLSTLVPCVSNCEKIKTINKIDEHFDTEKDVTNWENDNAQLYFSNN